MGRLVWIAAAYAVGTVPAPYVVARAGRRHDIIAAMRRRDSQGDAHFLLVKHASMTLGVVAVVVDMLTAFGPALAARIADQNPATLAWIGLAGVAGHCYPPYFRRSAGRGLSSAAGVSLALIPAAMVGSGIIALAGTLARRGGPGTSVGFALLPAFAAAVGASAPLIAMAGGIVVIIAARRLEGLGEDRRAGISMSRALIGRLLFDLPRGERAS